MIEELADDTVLLVGGGDGGGPGYSFQDFIDWWKNLITDGSAPEEVNPI